MNNLQRYIVIALSILVIGFLLYTFSNIVTYVLIAWVLSLTGQPFMSFLRKLRFSNFRIGENLAATISLVLFYIVIGGIGAIFVPLIIEQTNNLMSVDFNSIAIALEEPLNIFYQRLSKYGIKTGEISPAEQLQNAFGDFFRPSAIGNFFGSVISLAGSLLIGLFSVTFITFFFLKDKGLFKQLVSGFVSIKHKKKVKNAISETSKMLSRYFRGVIMQVSIITIFVTLGLSLLGVENALLIGLFAALINVVPYIGPLIGAGFAVIFTISSNLDLSFYNEMLPLLLKVIGVFAAMQLADNFILQPFIFSKSVQAHPLEIFLVILMGAQIDGIVGMILAIPAYTVLRVIAKNFLSQFSFVQELTKRMN